VTAALDLFPAPPPAPKVTPQTNAVVRAPVEQQAQAPEAASTGAGDAAVHIYRMTREWTTHMFLCERHAAARAADRWTAEKKEPVRFGCDDCHQERSRG
jgi:hypothetical protein